MVTALYRYPVKSCRGQALDDAEFIARGITHDREFLVIDASSGRFLTQRELPRLTLVAPTLIEGGLRLQAPGMPELSFERMGRGPSFPVTIWQDTVAAVDQGDGIAAWLTQFLGRPTRIVRMADDAVRIVDQRFARQTQDQVGFADGYPALLISEESLEELNRRLAAQGGEPVPMNRFRPNIVVRGAGVPHTEDTWREISIGTLTFAVVKPCTRCQITTTDQETGERGREPLRMLASYRRSMQGITFGQNLIHMTQGRIAVGDRIEVIASAMAPSPNA
jgi:uncharacterized protein YcbX